MKKKPINMATGRPTLYSEELVEKICLAIATYPIGLEKLSAKFDWFPHRDTIFEWISKYEEFSDRYARAKRKQIEPLMDEILEIADQAAFDSRIDDNGNVVPDHEYIQRSRIRIDTRKWLASKLVPKVYGDRMIAENTNINHVSHEDALKELS